ncbi:MAG: GFA family protein [bacterium]
MITGGCQCGLVQYKVDGELLDYCHCHCSICRRLHGAAFATWGGVSRVNFSYLIGENHLKAYAFSDRSDSMFCDTCGSRILVDFKPEPDMLYIALGTVNGDVRRPTGYHQFTGSKAPWYEINDDLSQYEGWSDDDAWLNR